MRCCVPYCNSDTRDYECVNNLKRSMHKFPKDKDVKNAWIIAIARKGTSSNVWNPTPTSVVCSHHFTANCFIPGLRKRLFPHAIPSLFSKYPSYMQNSKITKRFTSHIDVPTNLSRLPVTEDTEILRKKEKSNKKAFNFVARKEIRKVQIGSALVSSTDSTFDEKGKQQKTSAEELYVLGSKTDLVDEALTSDKSEDEAQNSSCHPPCDSSDIFGQYVASEMRLLKDNPLLYLQTKLSIFIALSNANFELINE